MNVNAKINSRGSYRYPEVAFAQGPEAISASGEGSLNELLGWDWMVVLDADSHQLHAYREDPAQDGTWTEVTTGLPGVFDTPLPATARRVTFCFDQSARIILAYEDQGVVHVTRWDTDTESYIQNVSFPGHDPQLLLDASFGFTVPGSDVLLFYLDATRLEVRCRVQRELYGTEHLLYTLSEPGVLDRAQPITYRYQLLLADAAGDVLPNVLRSDFYDPFVTTPVLATSTFVDASYSHYRDVYEEAEINPLVATSAFTNASYVSLRLVVEHAPPVPEALSASSLFLDGSYDQVRVIRSEDASDGVSGSAYLLNSEYHEYRNLTSSDEVDAFTGQGEFINAAYQEI